MRNLFCFPLLFVFLITVGVYQTPVGECLTNGLA